MKTITQALADDHLAVRQMLARVFSEPSSVTTLYPQIADALRRHDKAEAETLYRTLMSYPQETAQIDRSYHEHASVAAVLNDLDQIDYADPRFFSGLRELVRRLEQHLSVEETAVFAAARSLLPLARQQQLAERYEAKMGRGQTEAAVGAEIANPVVVQERKRPWWHHFVGPLAVYHRG